MSITALQVNGVMGAPQIFSPKAGAPVVPLPVSFKQEVGRVAATSGTQIVSLTGFSNQTIKAIIFYGATNTADGVNDHAGAMVGYSTGPTKNAVMAFASQHGVGTSVVADVLRPLADNRCVYFFDDGTPGNGIDTYGQAHVSAFGDNQFTLVWDVAPSAAFLLSFIVIGGEDVEAEIVDFLTPGTDGNVSYTLSFQPTALISLNVASSAGKSDHARCGLGFSDGITDRVVWVGAVNGVGTSDTKRRNEAEFIHNRLQDDTVQGIAVVDSLDTLGFTLAWSSTAASVFNQCSVLAFSGLRCEVGIETQKDDGTGTKQTFTNIPPEFLIMSSWGRAAAAGTQDHLAFNIGVADTTSKFSITSSDQDALVTTVTKSAVDALALDVRIEDGTQFARAVLDSVGSASFTLDWQVADAVAREFNWMVFAPLAPLEEKFKAEVGSFVADVAGGAQLVESATLDGQNIRAVMFFSSSQITSGFSDHATLMYGFSVPIAENVCIAAASKDGVATTDCASILTDKLPKNRSIYLFTRGAPSTTFGDHSSGHVTSFGNNHFIITWDVAPVEATIVNYVLLSGSELKAAILEGVVPTSDGKNVLTGTGFQPNAAIGILRPRNEGTIHPHAEICVGFAGKTEQTFLTGNSAGSLGTSDTTREFGFNSFLKATRADLPADIVQGNLESFDVDGLSVDWVNTNSILGTAYEVLALGGVQVDIGSGLKPVTPEERTYVADFAGQLLFTLSTRTGNFEVEDDIWLNILGASDGVNNRCAGVLDSDNQSTSICIGWQTDSVMDMRDTAGNEDGTAAVKSFDPQAFTLDWTIADTNPARAFVWMILSAPTSINGGPGGQIRHLNKFPTRWGNRRRFEVLR